LRALIEPRVKGFEEAVKKFGALPEDRREVAETTLTRYDRDQIRMLSEIADAKDKTLEALALDYLARDERAMTLPPGDLVAPLGACFRALEAATRRLMHAHEDWAHPSRWARLTFEQAGKAMDELEEVQTVLESILSDEWENNGFGMRWKLDGERRRPDHSLPVATIGPELKDKSWPSKQGLNVWPEKRDDRYIWEFVARDEPNKRRKRKET
jgi:hypothetical protein